MSLSGAILIAILSVFLYVVGSSSSRLPKFVDQQLNNQANEVLSNLMVPLQSIPCFDNLPVNCFRMKNWSRTPHPEWRFFEFQVGVLSGTIDHKFQLIVSKSMTDLRNPDEVIFKSNAISPDPILMDLIINFSSSRDILLHHTSSFYFLLVCVDCGQHKIPIKNANGIAFVIVKQDNDKRRSKRSVTISNECSSESNIASCCLQKMFVERSVIFDNSSLIVAPKTIPVTYCRGTCYSNMYRGNHNYALLRYFHSLANKSNLRIFLPCCSASKFRDFVILYKLEDGTPAMVTSSRFLVDSCQCE